MTTPDFMAMLDQRVASDDRPTHLAPIAFDFRAIADLQLLEDELQQAEAEQRVADFQQRTIADKPGDTRMAGNVPSRVAELKARQGELIERIQESTCLAVFKAPTADQQAVLNTQSKAEGWEPPEQARRLIMLCFDHWEYRGEHVESMDSSALEKLLPRMTQGELYSLSTPLTEISGGEVALPKSALAFIKTRAPGGTRRSRSGSASRSANGTAARPRPA
jgi:hypothetical protein